MKSHVAKYMLRTIVPGTYGCIKIIYDIIQSCHAVHLLKLERYREN